MFEFYKKSTIAFLSLLIITAALAYLGIARFYLHTQLLPMDKTVFAWQAQVESDADQSGHSTTVVHDDLFSLDVDFHVQQTTQYPYSSLAILFNDKQEQQRFVDLSRYQSLTFSVRCSPSNVLLFSAFTVDEKITDINDLSTYRTPTSFFSCDQQWRDISIDLTRLKIPQWWFDKYMYELSDQGYRLNNVPRFSIGTTHRSPMNVSANVKINELTLQGRDWRYVYYVSVAIIFLWCGFLFCFFKLHTKALVNELNNRHNKDRPLVAYQKLSIEPKKDKHKSAILAFMATEYANIELNLDMAIAELGVSRSKINDTLKEELGFTFSTYLNKLRLTEAARLLKEQGEISIAEIAYSVGYNNASYFNKLFKNEYGCTPKVFKNLQHNRILNNDSC